MDRVCVCVRVHARAHDICSCLSLSFSTCTWAVKVNLTIYNYIKISILNLEMGCDGAANESCFTLETDRWIRWKQLRLVCLCACILVYLRRRVTHYIFKHSRKICFDFFSLVGFCFVLLTWNPSRDKLLISIAMRVMCVDVEIRKRNRNNSAECIAACGSLKYFSNFNYCR